MNFDFFFFKFVLNLQKILRSQKKRILNLKKLTFFFFIQDSFIRSNYLRELDQILIRVFNHLLHMLQISLKLGPKSKKKLKMCFLC